MITGHVQKIDSINYAAWNVCGTKNKVNDPDFIQQLLPHDIIVFGETFAKDDLLHIPGYKCVNIFYKKKHKKAIFAPV